MPVSSLAYQHVFPFLVPTLGGLVQRTIVPNKQDCLNESSGFCRNPFKTHWKLVMVFEESQENRVQFTDSSYTPSAFVKSCLLCFPETLNMPVILQADKCVTQRKSFQGPLLSSFCHIPFPFDCILEILY